MTRKLKVLGLALVAVFALTAISATAASAESQFNASTSPVKVHATNSNNHIFHAGLVGNISCTEATFVSEGFQSFPRSTLTVTPTYKDCTFLGVPGVTVNTNECAYLFTTPTKTTSTTFHGKVDVECPTGKAITFAALGCEVTVGSQTELGSVEYHNLANGTVNVVSNVSGITYTSKGICNGPTGLNHDGVYTGAATVTGEDELGEPAEGFLE